MSSSFPAELLEHESGEVEEAAALKEEVTNLRERVAYLERDVEGLEAIVKNLADKERRMAKQLWRLWYDGRHNRPFHPSHDEDEFVSIFVVCCCVLVYFSYTYSSGTGLCGAFRSRLS